MAKIKLDHTTLSDNQLVARMREVGTAMTDNPVVAALAGRLPAYMALADSFETGISEHEASILAEKEKGTRRRGLREQCLEAMRLMASATEGETSDAALLLSTGWHLRAERAPVGPLPAPTNLSGSGGDMEGEAFLTWWPVSGRGTYIAEQSASATGPWTQVYIGRTSSCTVPGLVSGQLYYFRVRAIGAAGPGPWSDITQARAT